MGWNTNALFLEGTRVLYTNEGTKLPEEVGLYWGSGSEEGELPEGTESTCSRVAKTLSLRFSGASLEISPSIK